MISLYERIPFLSRTLTSKVYSILNGMFKSTIQSSSYWVIWFGFLFSASTERSYYHPWRSLSYCSRAKPNIFYFARTTYSLALFCSLSLLPFPSILFRFRFLSRKTEKKLSFLHRFLSLQRFPPRFLSFLLFSSEHSHTQTNARAVAFAHSFIFPMCFARTSSSSVFAISLRRRTCRLISLSRLNLHTVHNVEPLLYRPASHLSAPECHSKSKHALGAGESTRWAGAYGERLRERERRSPCVKSLRRLVFGAHREESRD